MVRVVVYRLGHPQLDEKAAEMILGSRRFYVRRCQRYARG